MDNLYVCACKYSYISDHFSKLFHYSESPSIIMQNTVHSNLTEIETIQREFRCFLLLRI